MFDRLEQMDARYESLSREMSDPTLVNDQKKYQAIAKEHRDMEPVIEKYRAYRRVAEQIAEAKAMLGETDPEIKAMAAEELATLEPRLAPIEEALKVLLLPKDPKDDKNIIIELRGGYRRGRGGAVCGGGLPDVPAVCGAAPVAGAGAVGVGVGHWGRLKEVTAIFEGEKVYSQMKYESGVHRVQRVPATETQGRVHTSAITVAVLPEAEEVDIKIEAKDLRIDTFCSCGAGGAVGEYDLLGDPGSRICRRRRW